MVTARANALVQGCLGLLTLRGVFAWRQNNAPVPIRRGPRIVGLRPVALKGIPDIVGVLPGGRFIGVECKTGSSRLSPEQIDFQLNVKRNGGCCVAVWQVEELVEILDEIEARGIA